jgi:hypothetical protein
VPVLCEGTGEANRAVEAARGTGLPEERPLLEPGDDAIGIARGREDDAPSWGVDISGGLLKFEKCCVCRTSSRAYLIFIDSVAGAKMTGSGAKISV